MYKTFRAPMLSALVAAALVGAWGIQATASFDEKAGATQTSGISTWMVEFAEPGLLHGTTRAAGARFDARDPAVVAYRDQLMQVQAGHKAAIAGALGRAPEVTHHYLASHSGMAIRLTAAEADQVARLPGVASVKPEVVEQIDTNAGPVFIGADTIWNGSAIPGGGPGTRGEGMVIAVLDTGMVSATHPSFANDASCGHGGANPNKVLSSLDCATTDGTGLCNGPTPTDTNGHGSHTASTSGGNRVPTSATPAPNVEISGVAPCANLRIYKVCPTTSCPGAAIQAGMDSILLHGGVDVMNFSISGGRNPWEDNDRKKLDLVSAGVFVAASAGNTSATITNPIGQVNHLGPWVLSVAASTLQLARHPGRLQPARSDPGAAGQPDQAGHHRPRRLRLRGQRQRRRLRQQQRHLDVVAAPGRRRDPDPQGPPDLDPGAGEVGDHDDRQARRHRRRRQLDLGRGRQRPHRPGEGGQRRPADGRDHRQLPGRQPRRRQHVGTRPQPAGGA